MKLKCLLVLFLFLIANQSFSQRSYNQLWAKVDSLEEAAKPTSALKLVEEIYAKAKNENNSPQFIKSLIFRLKFKNVIEDNSYANLITELENVCKNAQFPDNAIMHLMLADMYWQFYQNNYSKFYNRSNTAEYSNSAIETWSLDHIISKTIKEYNLALKDKDKLSSIPVSKYNLLINPGTKPKDVLPSLYDFIANNALKFYSNPQAALTKPRDHFTINEDFYFSDAEDFVAHKIITEDSLSLQYLAVKLYQDLLSFRLKKKDEENALVDLEFSFFKFVYSQSLNTNKEELYLKALKRLEKKYSSNPFSAEISYEIAAYYYKQSKNYNPTREETHKYSAYKRTAFDICKKLLEKYPDSYVAESCKQLMSRAEFHYNNLSFQVETVVPSKNQFLLNLNYQNLDTVFIRIAKITGKSFKNINDTINDRNQLFDELVRNSTPVREISQILPENTDIDAHSVELIMDKLPVGFYIIFVANNKNFTSKKSLSAYKEISVSDLCYVKQNASDGSCNYLLLDRTTGFPIEGVSAQTWKFKYDYDKRKYLRVDGEKYISDKLGLINLKNTGNDNVDFSKGSDFLTTYITYKSRQSKYTNTLTYFFTDRKIYRPGQIVYFKGIVLNSDGEKHNIMPDFNTLASLYDVNNQIKSSINLTTNEYGTFSGSFQIPLGLLNGNFSIRNAYGSIDFYVEEYKRPKFELEMLPFNGNYVLNDTVKVKGKAMSFSGAGLTDAEVKYKIVQTPIWSGWRQRNFDSRETVVKYGKVLTSEFGAFEISFLAEPGWQNEKNEFISFEYQITVDITDINGETHSTSKAIRVGWRALQVSLPVKSLIDKNDNSNLNKNTSKIEISTLNLNGEFIAAKGDIKIYKLKDNPIALRKGLWKQPDKHLYTKSEWYAQLPSDAYDNDDDIINLDTLKLVHSIKFDTEKSKEIDVSFFKDLSTGHYVVELFSKDVFGNPVSNKHFFSVYSQKGEQMPYKTKDFFVPVKTKCEPGEEAAFLIGSSDNNVQVLYEVEHKGKIVLSRTITINNEQKLIKYPVEEKHRGNFSAHFVFVKDNRIYNHTSTVEVPYSNKKLDIEFATFRNKLNPGENEVWKIKIKGPKGEKVAAELMATLYDASLDNFIENKWNFDIYKSFYAQRNWEAQAFSFANSIVLKNNPYIRNYSNTYPHSRTLFYDTFNWFSFYYNNKSYRYNHSTKKGTIIINVVMEPSDVRMEDVVVTALGTKREEKALGYAVGDISSSELNKKEIRKTSRINSKFSDVKVRTSFSETAFFYPQLQTNKDGDVIVQFTIPESLTKWKMMGMGITKDLKYGFIDNELITQKELMLMTNVPRFFREKDKITFPVKISNVSEKNLKGKVYLELFDALTMQPLNNIFQNKELKVQKFKVKAGANSVINWNLEIPEGIGAITYKVVAKTGKFSDGEQNTLPVLSNRMLVTESMPLSVKQNQSKEYKLEKLIKSDQSSTLKHHKLTLEFTSNPAWYALQALPYLMEYPYECYEQTFSRFFANSIASHIANSDPKIKKVFDSWANTPDSEALLSNLEKNEELKSVLLEETPWVADGKDESARKRRVGLLFDINRMSKELDRALAKMQQGQVSNGGWPWFNGMPESRYITQHVVSGMGYLYALGVKNVCNDIETLIMLEKAVSYLDIRIVEDYNLLKRDTTEGFMDKNHLNHLVIQYLYGRSFFKYFPISPQAKEARNYYLEQAEKYWKTQSKYMQGMIALALHRDGNAKTGIHVEQQIVASLKEHSTNDEEFGMYWKDNMGGYYWYDAPVEMQALMIEVFDEIADDQESVNDMKVWLLKQKQTQSWKTTRATLLAVYALLKRGSNWLSNDELVEIKMNEEIIDPKKIEGVDIEEGTGYFKTSWSGKEIKPGMGNITVTKKDEGVSWGALYWQYFEDLDKITPHETPLKLKKQLFIEKQTDRGTVLTPILDNNSLQIGDKVIVRIELSVDRRMEYVHLKDMRASGFEPINVISGYKYQGGLGYYECTKDAATNFFIGTLPKGTFVFEYPLRVTHKGDFSNGITTIQCMYAPEFTAHSEGIRVHVKE